MKDTDSGSESGMTVGVKRRIGCPPNIRFLELKLTKMNILNTHIKLEPIKPLFNKNEMLFNKNLYENQGK